MDRIWEVISKEVVDAILALTRKEPNDAVSERVRKVQSEGPDPRIVGETEENDWWIGRHHDMKSPGKIEFHVERLADCCWTMAADLKVSDTATLRLIFEFAVYVVYAHERFHHFCDVMGRVTGYRGGKRGTNYKADWQAEEALATAWSWREVQDSWPNAKQISPKTMKGVLDWWFEEIDAVGYRDWKCCRNWFEKPLALHLLPEPNWSLLDGNGCNLGDWLYSSLRSSSWTDASVKYSLAPSNTLLSVPTDPKSAHLFEAKSGDFICFDNPRLNSLEGAPEDIRGDVLLCDTKISFREIHKRLKIIGGGIWFPEATNDSHLLGLLLIEGLNRIIMIGLTGRLRQACEIINNHLPNTTGKTGKEAMYDCQEALINADLEDYAQL